MEVCDILQEIEIKTIPKKKKCKKGKWLSEKALQIAVKRKEAKGKGEKERHTHLNAEFQRIAKRDKKAFLSDQCTGMEENKRMGKTSDLSKKIRDNKETLHEKMGTIKDRNSRDLTEAEDIKKKRSIKRKALISTSSVKKLRKQWHPTQVLLPGKSHGQRSLVGCSPWGCKESDTTE